MLRSISYGAQDIANSLGYTPYAQPIVQIATPTTGQTVAIQSTTSDITLWCKPAGTLATLTIAFPSSPRVGQIVRIGSTNIVTALTLNGGTIINTLTSFVANQLTSYQCVEAGTWGRVS